MYFSTLPYGLECHYVWINNIEKEKKKMLMKLLIIYLCGWDICRRGEHFLWENKSVARNNCLR